MSREQEIRDSVVFEKKELEGRPEYRCTVASAFYIDDVDWLLAELERERAARKECEAAFFAEAAGGETG